MQSQMYQHRDQSRTPTSTDFSIHQMSKDLTRSSQSTPIPPIRLPMSPISNAIYMHPELTLTTLTNISIIPHYSQGKINQQSGRSSGHLGTRIYLLKYCFLLIWKMLLQQNTIQQNTNSTSTNSNMIQHNVPR